MTNRRNFLAIAGAWPVLASVARAALATPPYPSRPIRVIVPQSAGSPVDIVARKLAEVVSPHIGVPVIVDNRTGASGTIGTAEAARAAADGYTMLVTAGEPLVSGPAVMKLPYDADRDFKYISKLAVSTSGSVLVASPSIHVSGVPELLTLAKSSAAPLSYASFGPGSFPQLILESIARQAKLKFTEVPYKGSPPALQDVIAGNVQLGVFSVLQSEPFINAGKLKPLAIVGKSSRLPDVQTFAQAGFDRFIFQNKPWVGLMGPAALPADVVHRWTRAITSAEENPGFRKAVSDAGFDAFGNSPEQFAAEYRSEAAAVRRLVKELGVAT